MMGLNSHLSDGEIRRTLDEPSAVGDTELAHLAGCGRCRGEAERARADADAVTGALGGARPAAVDAAWGRLVADLRTPDLGGDRPVVAMPVPDRRPRRLGLSRPVAIVATVAVLAVGSTAAAAAGDLLQIFRPRAVAPVSFSMQELSGLPDLSAYGTLDVPSDFGPERVGSAAEAKAKSGIAVPKVSDLPRGVTGAPSYAVITAGSPTFTFSAARAKAAAARQGQALPALPAGMDGSKLKVNLGPGVVAIWGQDRSVPTLAVVRMKAPTASAEGVPVATLRSYLLAQPGLPAPLAAQLRALPVDGSVLPIPVPEGVVAGDQTTVDGAKATVLSTKDGAATAVIWIGDGRLNAVFGSVDSGEALDVARGLD